MDAALDRFQRPEPPACTARSRSRESHRPRAVGVRRMHEQEKDAEPRRPRHAETLLPELYDELRSLAAARLARVAPGQTLQPTALVHEAFMKLTRRGDPGWDNEAHFFGAAARAMREILVDQARRKASVKHGGNSPRVELDDAPFVEAAAGHDLPRVDEALSKLEAIDPRKGEIVMLRFFGGLTNEQTAATLGTSLATVNREWKFAKLWLRRELEREDGADG